MTGRRWLVLHHPTSSFCHPVYFPPVVTADGKASEAIALPLGLLSSSSVNQSLPQACSLLSSISIFLYSVHLGEAFTQSTSRRTGGGDGDDSPEGACHQAVKATDPGCCQSPKKRPQQEGF